MKKVTEPTISTRHDAVLGRLVHGIGKLGNVLRNGAWASARAEGLTPTQGQILVLLRGRGRKGLRLASVAGELNITPATASDAVSTLQRKGLVERHRDPDDGRAIAVQLTPEGRRVAFRAMQWPEFMAEAFSCLSEQERGVMLRGLSKAMQALAESDHMQEARMCWSCAYFRPSGEGDPHCAFGDFQLNDIDLRLDCAAHVAAP
jgi:DNA-binding MarR family transcriptional regulator